MLTRKIQMTICGHLPSYLYSCSTWQMKIHRTGKLETEKKNCTVLSSMESCRACNTLLFPPSFLLRPVAQPKYTRVTVSYNTHSHTHSDNTGGFLARLQLTRNLENARSLGVFFSPSSIFFPLGYPPLLLHDDDGIRERRKHRKVFTIEGFLLYPHLRAGFDQAFKSHTNLFLVLKKMSQVG